MSFISIFTKGVQFTQPSNSTPPIPNLRPLSDVPRGTLFTHPCATPIDFTFSPEVLPSRKAFWTVFIEVSIGCTMAGFIECGQTLGGRIIPWEARELGTCCIIVPDWRIWLPSQLTLSLVSNESFTLSVLGEEWLSLCYDRQYLLPPSYVRMMMVAEYLRIPLGSKQHFDQMQRTALLNSKQHIPPTSDTENLLDSTFKVDLTALFSVPPGQWFCDSTFYVSHSLAGRENSLQTILLSTFLLGSPFQLFTEPQWDVHYWSEVKLLNSTDALYQKLHGYWPSQPFPEYHKPSTQTARNPKGRDFLQRQWISDMIQLMEYKVPINDNNHSKMEDESIPSRAMTRLEAGALNAFEAEDGTYHLGLASARYSEDTSSALPSHSEKNSTAFLNAVVSELERNEASQWASEELATIASLKSEAASGDIQSELVDAMDVDPPSGPISIEDRTSTLREYVERNEGVFPCGLPEKDYRTAVKILSGISHGKRDVLAPPTGQATPHSLCFDIDIDSAWASFRGSEPWPFVSGLEVQIHAVGPYKQAIVGSSKFRVDPGGGNELAWNRRVRDQSWKASTHGRQVPMHHFPNTVFLTVGAKTNIYAVFPKLRDISEGHKTVIIKAAQLEIWYDQVVRPAAERVFGDPVIRHWPLAAANHLWRDKHIGRQTQARYAIPAEHQQAGVSIENMGRFLGEIDRIVNDAEVSSSIADLAEVFYVIQRQNEKLQHRSNDIMERCRDKRTGVSPGQCLTDAIEYVQEKAFNDWRRPLPIDTHIDIGVEMASFTPQEAPFCLLAAHPYILQHYLDKSDEESLYMMDSRARSSEHYEYHIHHVAGLKSIAGMNWKTRREVASQLRELKVYHTLKEPYYQAQGEKNIQQPHPSVWLSHNTAICNHLNNFQGTLGTAINKGTNAVRIECTIPFARARTSNIFPSMSIISHFAMLHPSIIWRYQSLKLRAIETVHHHMTKSNRFEVERQQPGPLSLLAALHWYHETLFSRASHRFFKDRNLFEAISGPETDDFDPLETGQVAFAKVIFPQDTRQCPRVDNTLALPMTLLITHFRVGDTQSLVQLVTGRDRAQRQVGKKLGAFPSLAALLKFAQYPSAPLSTLLQIASAGSVLEHLDQYLSHMDNDMGLEALFVGMIRTIWYRLPSNRDNGKDTPNLAQHIDVEDVRYRWAAAELRRDSTAICGYFRHAVIETKTDGVAWNELFRLLFGVLDHEGWRSLGGGIEKMSHLVCWTSLMTGLAEDHSLRNLLYRTMRAKFDTLEVMPKMKISGNWETKTVVRIRAKSRASFIILLQNPGRESVGDIWRAAGYLGVPAHTPARHRAGAGNGHSKESIKKSAITSHFEGSTRHSRHRKVTK